LLSKFPYIFFVGLLLLDVFFYLILLSKLYLKLNREIH
jgi:hypothetical protein